MSPALAQFHAVAAERAAIAPNEGKLWALLAGALSEFAEQQVAPGKPVLTVKEACRLVNVGSDSALQRWCKTWRVEPSGHGRYPRRALMAGLEREADSRLRRRRTPEKKS